MSIKKDPLRKYTKEALINFIRFRENLSESDLYYLNMMDWETKMYNAKHLLDNSISKVCEAHKTWEATHFIDVPCENHLLSTIRSPASKICESIDQMLELLKEHKNIYGA